MQINRIEVKSSLFRDIPKKPGIYRFYDENDNLLYVGASSNLSNRINQHFISLKKSDKKQHAIRQFSKHIEYQCFSTSEKAFEAERIEIWTHHPTLNKRGVVLGAFSYLVIRLAPYLHIKCFSGDDYSKIKDVDEFYRLNTSNINLVELLQCIRKQIPFCMPTSYSSCWDQQIGLCNNSCKREIKKEKKELNSQFKQLVESISGENQILVTRLRDMMTYYVENLEFERARNVLNALDSIHTLRLYFCAKGRMRDMDQFIFQGKDENSGEIKGVKVIIYKDGKEIFKKNEEFHVNNNISNEKLIFTYLINYYKHSSSAPNTISLNFPLSERLSSTFLMWFKRYFGKKVTIKFTSALKYY
ncbi:MAG: GIY-YIG nuclease family protein [Candidatus Hodarchaeales archaeon]|jgi:excinuclease ABC subunit C